MCLCGDVLYHKRNDSKMLKIIHPKNPWPLWMLGNERCQQIDWCPCDHPWVKHGKTTWIILDLWFGVTDTWFHALGSKQGILLSLLWSSIPYCIQETAGQSSSNMASFQTVQNKTHQNHLISKSGETSTTGISNWDVPFKWRYPKGTQKINDWCVCCLDGDFPCWNPRVPTRNWGCPLVI